jgi:chemotaxis protein methyltransferase CheR
MSQLTEVKLPDLSRNLNPALPKQLYMPITLFQEIRKFIYDNTGIYFQDNKKYLLESRLQRRINFLGLKSFEEYFAALKSGGSGFAEEKKYFYEAITINETFFFRNQPQLDALASQIFPDLISNRNVKNRNKIRIWSAASSSGEEAYSIAMVFQDLIKPKHPNTEIEIIGTDISSSIIDTANQGVYKDYSIRNTPPYYLKKYFKNKGGLFEVVPEIKRMASFKLLNLYDDFMMKTMLNFDIIFCANVLIYFDTASKIKVVNHLYNSLHRGGYLFIGYSETLQGISKAFSLVSFPKTVGYKKE